MHHGRGGMGLGKGGNATWAEPHDREPVETESQTPNRTVLRRTCLGTGELWSLSLRSRLGWPLNGVTVGVSPEFTRPGGGMQFGIRPFRIRKRHLVEMHARRELAGKAAAHHQDHEFPGREQLLINHHAFGMTQGVGGIFKLRSRLVTGKLGVLSTL